MDDPLDPLVLGLVRAIRARPRREGTRAPLDRALAKKMPASVRAFLEAWSEHTLVDLRVGALHLGDAVLEPTLRADMLAFGRVREWHDPHSLALKIVGTTSSLVAVEGGYDRSLGTLRSILESRWRAEGESPPENVADDLVQKIRAARRRAQPHEVLSRMLALELEASLRAVIEAWRDHALSHLAFEGIELTESALAHALGVHEKDGRGPHAGFHLVEGETRKDAIVIGRVKSSIAWHAGFWINSSGLQDHVILEAGRRSTKGGAFATFLRLQHERALAAGERSDLAVAPR